jgi:hypothetical protein
MEIQPCTECGAMTFMVLTEPDGKPVVFDAQATKAWHMQKITPSHSVGVPLDVHTPHVLSCKHINRSE